MVVTIVVGVKIVIDDVWSLIMVVDTVTGKDVVIVVVKVTRISDMDVVVVVVGTYSPN